MAASCQPAPPVEFPGEQGMHFFLKYAARVITTVAVIELC